VCRYYDSWPPDNEDNARELADALTDLGNVAHNANADLDGTARTVSDVWHDEAGGVLATKLTDNSRSWAGIDTSARKLAGTAGDYAMELVDAKHIIIDVIARNEAEYLRLLLNAQTSDLAASFAQGVAAYLRRVVGDGQAMPQHTGGGIFGPILAGLEHVAGDLANGVASLGNAMLHDPGAVGETLAGAALMALSAGGEVGGAALDATGVGAVLGVPANVVSAMGIATGAGMAGLGVHTLAQDAAGPDKVTQFDSANSGGDGASGPGDGASNRIRPAVDGDTNYVVDNPSDPSQTITDIDRVDNGTLWEEKTATGQDPRMNIPSWVNRNVTGKLDSYVQARQYMPGYENAPLGLDFTRSGTTPGFQQAVQDAVDQWKAANPGIPVSVRWAP
jgi:hypothetical protein